MIDTHINYFKNYIEECFSSKISYNIMKIIESLDKNGKIFDDNDWNKAYKLALENEIIAFAIVENKYAPVNVRASIMEKYKDKESFRHFLYSAIHKQNLTEEEVEKYSSQIKDNNEIQKMLIKSGKVDENPYGKDSLNELPLSKGIANQLVKMYENGEIASPNIIQYRYADFKRYNEKPEEVEEYLFRKITSGCYNEDIITEIANNKNLSNTFRNKVFDYGCNFNALVDITPHMAQEIYRVCVETLSNLDNKENTKALYMARGIFIDLLKSKKLPDACEMDFISRWKNIELNNIDGFVFTTFLNNCVITAKGMCCDMDTTSMMYAEYILTNEYMCKGIPENIKKGGADKLIEYYDAVGILNPNSIETRTIRIITDLIINAGISHSSFLILNKYNNPEFFKALLISPIIEEERLKVMKTLTDDGYKKFYIDVVLEMKNANLQNFVPFLKSFFNIVDNRDTVIKEKESQEIIKNIYDCPMLPIDEKDMEKIFGIMKECGKNYKDLKDLEDLVAVFETLKREKYEEEKCYYNNPYFDIEQSFVEPCYENMANNNSAKLLTYLSPIPKSKLQQIKRYLDNLIYKSIAEYKLYDINIRKKLTNMRKITENQNVYNVVNTILNDKELNKGRENLYREVEF